VRMSSTDPTVVFVGGDGGLLLMCNTATGARTPLQGHQRNVYGLCVSNDGKLLASSSNDKTVKLWSTVSGRCLWTSSGQADMVSCVAMQGDMVLCGVDYSNTVGLRKSDGTAGLTCAAKATAYVYGLAVAMGEEHAHVCELREENAGSAHIQPRLLFVAGFCR
jgi:WD40 repeat protein